ncbi:sugar-binding domain-containing protein [uncultured Ferrimonas sp.]|uniref:glycoside hydrolase family 2 protein n=1 Tax=uncultured Ferrimonas sp. TaxID=432640 RepID=UPI00260908CD|nr:sugar-binding domain-containing protein [uncultured Ferrimonas sp.]
MKPLQLLLALLTAVLLLSGCQSAVTQPAQGLPDLNGPWRFQVAQAGLDDLDPVARHFDDSGWASITVPGNWYQQGYDVAGKHWYRKQFQLASLPSSGLLLNFSGVDYRAQVWLNGQFIGSHQGYFSQFQFDVSDVAVIGRNTLSVRVDSPLEQQQDVSWSLHKTLIKGVLSHHDTRPGGAWTDRGQERNTGGIWGQVSLQAKPSVIVQQLKWRSEISGDSAQGQLQFDVDGLEPSQWRVTLTGIGFEDEQQFEFDASAGRQTLTLPWRAWQLWWPREYGLANRYQLSLAAISGNREETLLTTEVGFRQIHYDGQLGQWYLNQQRLFLRGTNYIPSLYMADVDEAMIRRDLALMAAANVNIVRVHAMVLPQRFYQVANELGMMVWQDFPLQWGYIDTKAFQQEAQRQMTQMLSQFGHHPSIVAWSAHNEPPWDADWMKWKYPDYDPNQNKALDMALYQTLQDHDRSRPSFVASLTKEHPWLGWYSGNWRDYGKPSQQSLITEFGAQALPDLPVWSSVVNVNADLSLPQDFEQWQFHNFQAKESFEIAGVDKGRNVVELIHNSQQYQARLIRYAAESLRRQKYHPVGGIFQFMMVEHWPSANWGILDFNRNPKPGYQALQVAYQPVMPSIMHDQDRFTPDESVSIPIYLLNDLPVPYPDASLQLQLMNAGRLVASDKRHFDLAPDSVAQLAPFPSQPLTAGGYQLYAKLFASNGELLGESQFVFEVSDEQ